MSAARSLPAGSFELLYEAPPEEAEAALGLPERFRAVYNGDWLVPRDSGRPYVYVNFVTSRDGRVSFMETGQLGGVHVAGHDLPDRWLMGVLRARADAVLVGEGTVRAEAGHVWTHERIWPEGAASLSALRAAEGRTRWPLQVVLSLEGDVPVDAATFTSDLDVVVATTERGRGRVPPRLRCDVVELGADLVALERLVTALGERYGVRTLLCEGGPRVYGSLLRARLGHDEFLTLSPLVVGEAEAGPRRPSLVEGAAFAPGAAPRARLLSVRRAGDHLYLRSRYPAA